MYEDFSYIPPPPPEDSDEEDEKLEPLKWNNNVTPPQKFDLFLLFERESAVEYANKCIITKSYKIDGINAAGVSLYKIPNADIFVCTSLCRSDKTYGEIVDVLQVWLKNAVNRVIIQSSALAHFKSNEDKNYSTIRALRTPNFKEDKSTTSLEIPNVATGITAGVINYSDFFKLSAISYMCYLETNIFGFDKPIADKLAEKLKMYNVPFTQTFKSSSVGCSSYL